MPTIISTSQVVDTMQSYLGPAAERFVYRMLETHLHKQPTDTLSANDIQLLGEKVEAALKHLDQDATAAQEARSHLQLLAN